MADGRRRSGGRFLLILQSLGVEAVIGSHARLAVGL